MILPREYQLKTTGNTLPHNVYMQVVYIIRDYHRMLNERNNIMFSSSYGDGQPRGNDTSDTTANKAIKLSALSNRIDGIDSAIHDVNAEYSNRIKREDVDSFDCLDAFNDYGGFCYMLYDPKEGRQPCVRTWKYFRQTLAFKIAKNLNLI